MYMLIQNKSILSVDHHSIYLLSADLGFRLRTKVWCPKLWFTKAIKPALNLVSYHVSICIKQGDRVLPGTFHPSMCVDNQWHFSPAIVAILVLKMGVQVSNILTITNRVTFRRNVSIKEAPEFNNQVIHESLHAPSLVMIWTARSGKW